MDATKPTKRQSHDRQSYLRHSSNRRFCYHLFCSVRNRGAFRRKLERGRPDHPWPLRKHSVGPRNKRRPNLLWRWIILRRLPGAVGRPCLPFRACPGECSSWPAQRIWNRTARAVSGQRDLVRSRAVRCMLRRLERRSILTQLLGIRLAWLAATTVRCGPACMDQSLPLRTHRKRPRRRAAKQRDELGREL
jgi:hypothetical protein